MSESDKKAATFMQNFYEESAENVSRIYQKTNDWEKTNKQLEKQFLQSMKKYKNCRCRKKAIA